MALACALAAGLAVAGVEIVPLLLVTLVPWAAGRLLRSRRELVQALAERNRALEAEQAALAELAVRRSARGSPASCTTSSPTTSR